MGVIFLVIVMTSIGFGLVLPAFMFYAENLGGSPAAAAAIVATYSFGQMIATPIWGRLSDRFGRKPILVASLTGATLSYLGLAFAQDLWLLALARGFGGLMAGNFSAAMAYVTDITSTENRAKGMGVVGAGISLGFIVGPAIGGLLSGADAGSATLLGPGLAAAAMSAVTLLAVLIFLKESLPKAKRRSAADLENQPTFLAAFVRVMERPVVLRMVLIGFLFVGAQGMFETIFPLWAKGKFDWGPREVGYLFTWLGIVVGVVQGGLIGRLAKRFGEKQLLVFACVVYIAGLGTMAATLEVAIAMLGITFTAIAAALFNPSISSLVSQQAGEKERGLVLGVYQSATWLGRGLGPLASGVLFGSLGREAPLIAGVLLCIPCLWLAIVVRNRATAPAEGSAAH